MELIVFTFKNSLKLFFINLLQKIEWLKDSATTSTTTSTVPSTAAVVGKLYHRALLKFDMFLSN